MPDYYDLDTLIGMIEDDKLQSVARTILEDNRALFMTAPGSSHNHQNWPGGYWDHVTECMNQAVVLFAALDNCRPLPFTLGEALFVMFVHDLEKPWRYRLDEDGQLQTIPELLDKDARKAFRDKKLEELGVYKSNYPAVLNALMTVEGENENYSPQQRVMWPLGGFCHMCDITSARIWPNYPHPPLFDHWAPGRINEAADDQAPYKLGEISSRDCPRCGNAPDGERLQAKKHVGATATTYHCPNCHCLLGKVAMGYLK